MADTQLNAKIIRQVEYYFGDINLSKDTFMKRTIEEKDGWFPFDTLLKFKRLNQLSSDIEVIKTALADSELIEVGENGIRRNAANPPPDTISEALTLHSDRALYVKGFPYESTLDELMGWIESVAGVTYDVFLRRLPNRKFKGSIYITFKTKECADKFMTSADCAEYKGSPLLRKWYTDYLEDKKNERLAKVDEKAKKLDKKKADITSQMTAGALLELSGLPECTPRASEKPEASGDAVKDGEKAAEGDAKDSDKAEVTEKATEDDAKDSDKAEVPEKTTEDEAKDDKTSEEKLSEEKKPNGEMNSVVQLKEWLNEKLESSVQIAWIDVQPAANKAIVRFREPNTATGALEKLTKAFEDGKIMYRDSLLTSRVVEGDEELDFWKNLLIVLSNKKRKGGRQSSGGRGGGGGRFGKRRRHN